MLKAVTLEWRHTIDSLPERNQEVIVCRTDGTVQCGRYDRDGWWRVFGCRTKQVSHWMPLPGSPEVEPNARRDKDNISAYGRKVIQDALVKGGFLAGDGWKYIVGFSDEFGIDRARPRIEVRIYEEDEYAQSNKNADSGNSNNLRAAGAAGAAAPIGGAGR